MGAWRGLQRVWAKVAKCAAPYLVDDADEVVEAGLRLGGVAE